ncbi:MAG: hypothetical protein K0R61_5303 [Microvirga sp.]|jgi:hypothetical protein|nr:hypothetical protein [Microvirga sp.]
MEGASVSEGGKPSAWSNLLTYGSAMILVGTEVYGVALAAAWALGGFFELGDTITSALYVIAAVLATYVMYVFGRRAYGVDAGMEAAERHRALEGRAPPSHHDGF